MAILRKTFKVSLVGFHGPMMEAMDFVDEAVTH